MRTIIAALAVAAAFSLAAPSAKAQLIFPSGPPALSAEVPYAGPGFAPAPYVPPYSYYAALPFRAREYVGYGSNDFPFYGRPYGHLYDPWTWEYMGRMHNVAPSAFTP